MSTGGVVPSVIATGASELQVCRCPLFSACRRIGLRKIKAGTGQRVAVRDAVATSGLELRPAEPRRPYGRRRRRRDQRPCCHPGAVNHGGLAGTDWSPYLTFRDSASCCDPWHSSNWAPPRQAMLLDQRQALQPRGKRRQRRQQTHGFAPAARLTSPDRLLAYK